MRTSNLNIISRKKKLRKGFTLVEIIVYMALMAVFLIVLTDIFVSILGISTESEATSAVEQDGRSIISRFHFDIANSDSITIPAGLGSTNSTLELIADGTTYEYSLWGERLVVNDGTETHAINSTETQITDISFQRIGNPGGNETIRIQFDIESVTIRASGVESRSFTTAVQRR